MLKDTPRDEGRQERSRMLEKQLVRMLWPALVALKQRVDRRLVKTFLGLVMVLVMHRHHNHGLVLSELGGKLDRGISLAAGEGTSGGDPSPGGVGSGDLG